MKRDLLFYIYGGGSEWAGICVDLDIGIVASSQDEAFAKMKTAVESYVKDALQEDAATCRRLLSRSSPWTLRFRLWLEYQLFLMQRTREHKRSVSAMAMPCPA